MLFQRWVDGGFYECCGQRSRSASCRVMNIGAKTSGNPIADEVNNQRIRETPWAIEQM